MISGGMHNEDAGQIVYGVPRLVKRIETIGNLDREAVTVLRDVPVVIHVVRTDWRTVSETQWGGTFMLPSPGNPPPLDWGNHGIETVDGWRGTVVLTEYNAENGTLAFMGNGPLWRFIEKGKEEMDATGTEA